MNFREGLKNLAPFVELVSAWVEERNSPVIFELINYSTKAAELLPDRIGFQLAVLIRNPFTNRRQSVKKTAHRKAWLRISMTS
ncbi:hypothetical protein DPX16_15231 [Anabarilius grahami]|uniref:Uncharacterized protein n=1 Tax=Anabarilius grahami TaxID=495550 RepID=A0A3N0XVF0_ANAGA|nr:hypothetical protein DPX16_15231 [Anabarilius grahami]